MKSVLRLVVVGGVVTLGALGGAHGQTVINPRNTANYNQRRGSTTFVGTISSISVSNRTLEVLGADSCVVTTYQANRTTNTRNRTTTTTSNQPQRSLQTTGKEETRTFSAGGFCRIEMDGSQAGKLGGNRGALADLKVGDRVSIEYITGIGNNYTAKFIQPLAALKVTDSQKNQKADPKKKKN
jgi:hypothetical protein